MMIIKESILIKYCLNKTNLFKIIQKASETDYDP